MTDSDELMLTVWEDRYARGDHMALMKALRCCLANRLAVPSWAVAAFCNGVRSVERLDAGSWDDVFGKPHKGRKLGRLRAKRDLQLEVFRRVQQMRKERPKPINIFQRVADKLNISRATCKRYFDEINRLSKPKRY
jgi:hypothetical protein